MIKLLWQKLHRCSKHPCKQAMQIMQEVADQTLGLSLQTDLGLRTGEMTAVQLTTTTSVPVQVLHTSQKRELDP
jgi:hypothetical protein